MTPTDKLSELLAAATPGPWRVSKIGLMNDGSLPVSSEYGRIGAADIHCEVKRKDAWQSVCPMRDANAALIAMAPDLAAEVIRLSAALADEVEVHGSCQAALREWMAEAARLTAERDAAVAAKAALMVRMDEARRLMDRGLWLTDDGPAARAWLEGKS